MTRRLAIIPARGGSKRVPRKNIRDFCGKPMIAHILDTAKKSALFDVMHVSTEDDEIRRVAAACGVAPEFGRPSDLAGDIVPLMPVLKFVVETYRAKNTEFDEIWLLMACAPLVDAADLIGAARLSESKGSKQSILSIAKYSVPIDWAFEREDDGRLVPVSPGMFAKSSSELTARYHDTGTFAVFPAERVLMSSGAGSDEGFLGYELPATRAIDIDSEEDWAIAEAIFKTARHRA